MVLKVSFNKSDPVQLTALPAVRLQDSSGQGEGLMELIDPYPQVAVVNVTNDDALGPFGSAEAKRERACNQDMQPEVHTESLVDVAAGHRLGTFLGHAGRRVSPHIKKGVWAVAGPQAA